MGEFNAVEGGDAVQRFGVQPIADPGGAGL
jgi:hypothetical protein